jgi:hypothetical protein
VIVAVRPCLRRVLKLQPFLGSSSAPVRNSHSARWLQRKELMPALGNGRTVTECYSAEAYAVDAGARPSSRLSSVCSRSSRGDQANAAVVMIYDIEDPSSASRYVRHKLSLSVRFIAAPPGSANRRPPEPVVNNAEPSDSRPAPDERRPRIAADFSGISQGEGSMDRAMFRGGGLRRILRVGGRQFNHPSARCCPCISSHGFD